MDGLKSVEAPVSKEDSLQTKILYCFSIHDRSSVVPPTPSLIVAKSKFVIEAASIVVSRLQTSKL